MASPTKQDAPGCGFGVVGGIVGAWLGFDWAIGTHNTMNAGNATDGAEVGSLLVFVGAVLLGIIGGLVVGVALNVLGDWYDSRE